MLNPKTNERELAYVAKVTELLLQCETKKEIDKLFNQYNDNMEALKWKD